MEILGRETKKLLRRVSQRNRKGSRSIYPVIKLEPDLSGGLAPERSKQKDWKKNYEQTEVFSTFQVPYPQAVFDLKG